MNTYCLLAFLTGCILALPALADTRMNVACLSLDPFADADQAADLCAKAVDAIPDSPLRAQILQQLGLAQRDLGLLNESLSSLSRAAVLAPGDAEVLHQLGWTYRLLDNKPAAERALRASLAISLDAPTVLSLCVVLQDQGEFAQSIDPCETALRLFGPNIDTSFFMARGYAGSARWSEAMTAAGEGISHPDPGPRLYIEAARAAWNLNAHPQAIELIQKGLKAYPLNKDLLLKVMTFPMFDD